MPLRDGLNAFLDGYVPGGASDALLEEMFNRRKSLVEIFRENPELITAPYAEASASGSKGYPEVAKNKLFQALILKGFPVSRFSAIVFFPSWKNVAYHNMSGASRSTSVMGYSLLDAIVYFLHLLNVYEPNASFIKNIYGTNVQTNALGDENLTVVEGIVTKLYLKTSGIRIMTDAVKQRGQDLVRLAKFDLAKVGTPLGAKNGIEFERACASTLRSAGFSVQSTPTSGDFGADLIAHKDGLGYAIQCKDLSKPVGVAAVQEASGARAHYRVDYAVVCASGTFTDAAVGLATSNSVILCNLNQLARRLDAV